jgi:hypothetical protein
MISLPEYAEPSPITHILCGVEDYEAEFEGRPITIADLFALGWDAVASARMRKTSDEPWFHWGKQGTIDFAPYGEGWTAAQFAERGIPAETIETLIQSHYGIAFKIGADDDESRGVQLRRREGYWLALRIAYRPG